MMSIRKRIERKIRRLLADPRTARPLSATGLLQGGAWIFRCLTRLRTWCYETGLFKTHRLPCTVISIGNITSGGTGKTPMTLYVANHLRDIGYRIAILSRGYKGGAEKKGGIVSDGRNLFMTPRAAGDEPFMMARFLQGVPVLVGRDRVASGRLAVSRFSPDILLLDDGFQHRRLHRDIDIVLLDSRRPLGNRFLLPRGSLRESPDALTRADAIVFTRWVDGLPDPESLLPESCRTRPVFRSRHVPYIDRRVPPAAGPPQTIEIPNPSDLQGFRIFAFSAIADNRDFHRVLTDLGARMVGAAEFADHHAYRPGELEVIGRKAVAADAAFLVTTQKDFSKLPPDTAWPRPLVVIGVLPTFVEKNGFVDFLANAVSKTTATK